VTPATNASRMSSSREENSIFRGYERLDQASQLEREQRETGELADP
jgi:hypothetical protein